MFVWLFHSHFILFWIFPGDLACHFGCTVGLKDSVTAVVFVALGTSVPGECVRLHNGQGDAQVMQWFQMSKQGFNGRVAQMLQKRDSESGGWKKNKLKR